ncbi:alpha/beta hydrolase [Salipiger thiooxidans]|uniref:alpha/beta family hydrolase n=1 Tax=Salipiger thiooxidans TaxID=282683 RepID=UPI001A8CC1B5|nr:alpha/beta family hydrolase [Salipiger thiooxidans]MBN8186699.1 alpha/beta hydrolase [Salipiger thiooxidans]
MREGEDVVEFLIEGDAPGRSTVLLAHGAGAAMDSGFMELAAAALAESGLRVARFEFAYMAGRRSGGSKRPPPRIESLRAEYLEAIDALAAEGPLIIGGKSMGGRVASLVADEAFAAGRIAGLFCLGYPFHPTGKPERLRTEHLETLATPALICQGTRDPFGTQDEVAGYALSPTIQLCWLEDGDHDLKPRRARTSATQADHIAEAARTAARWSATLTA